LNSSFSLPDHGRVFIDSSSVKPGSNEQHQVLVIALSVQAAEYPQRFSWARDNAFALEYTPDPLAPNLISGHVRPFTEAGIPVRFHCRFFNYDLGNADSEKAEEAVQVHSHVIDAIAGLGEPVITVHLNLDSRIPFDSQRAVENLTRLVERGRQVGITVCLENLRRGPTSDPDNVLAWAKASGAMITLDVGHAVSSQIVKDGKTTVPDIVDLFRERLYEVHMYGKEEDRHYPIVDITPLRPVIDRLLETSCTWWTIELDDYEEALGTRTRLLDYLMTRQTTTEGGS